jgi:hypothetical protein
MAIDPELYPIKPHHIDVGDSERSLLGAFRDNFVLARAAWLAIRMSQDAGCGFRAFTRQMFQDFCGLESARSDELLDFLVTSHLIEQRSGEFLFTHDLIARCFWLSASRQWVQSSSA